jgi:hypothetical protein
VIVMKRKKIKRLVSALVFLLLSVIPFSSSHAVSLYLVGTPVTGQEYYSMQKQWHERELSIWIGITVDKKVLLVFKGETGVGMAAVIENDVLKAGNELLAKVSKAIEWAEVARNNYADTSRGLGCFGADPNKTCERSSKATAADQMSLRFFAANEGRQADLIMHIIDRQSPFKEAEIYFDYTAMKKLREVVYQIEDAYEKAKKNAEKQDLFR